MLPMYFDAMKNTAMNSKYRFHFEIHFIEIRSSATKTKATDALYYTPVHYALL